MSGILSNRAWEQAYRAVASPGSVALSSIATFKAMVVLLGATLGSLFTASRPARASFSRQISRQILYTGVEAMPLVSVIAFVCGVTIIIQATTNMPKFGATEYIGSLLVRVVVRELGPFFTSLVVIGRSGSALAAYLGTMRVGRETSALEMMGIDPVHFLVIPAFAGFIISMVCLNMYFSLIAIIGGLSIAQLTINAPFGIFIEKILAAMHHQEVWLPLLKSGLFGAIIAIVSCHYGLAVRNIRAVPQAAIKAVMTSMAATIVVNILATVLVYAVER